VAPAFFWVYALILNCYKNSMSSISSTASVTCACGEEFDAEVWSFVHGEKDEELCEALLGGELNLVFCPKCGTYFHYETPVVYFDRSRDLLVFILPLSYQEKKDEWAKKMREDFELLRSRLLGELKISSAPLTVFGMEAAQQLLRDEIALREESEVIAAIAVEMGMKCKAVPPSAARSHGLPLCLPYSGTACDAHSLLAGAESMLKEHEGLERLKTLVALLRGGEHLHCIL